ncbi:MAG: hypothetical protein JST84_16810 [Acidobacteria bacterium]|nr:hypothetical protein [Acidobacteriota bacterium]
MANPITASQLSRTSQSSQYLLALLVLVACLVGIWTSSRIGTARMLAMYGVATNRLPAMNEAVRITPYDSEVRFARARALLNAGQVTAALPELEHAAALQPRNYGIWAELSGIYDLANQPDKAITAINQAIRLAPSYAHPHWQLGNLLLRKGQRQEAFREFRLAANADSSLVPNAVDLAWGAFNGKAAEIEQALQPDNDLARLELAKVFATRGAADDAMRVFRQVQNSAAATGAEREKLQAELFKSKRYYEAWEVWAKGQDGGATLKSKGTGAITDGGFEKQISLTEVGFGWRINPEKPTVVVTLDTQNPFADATSLQIHWEGKSSTSVYTIWQIVLVEPNKRYQLNFAARTKDLVSGGLPEIAVLNDFEGQVLASATLPQGTSSWQKHSLEFTSPATKQVVYLIVRRKSCTVLSCPAFGSAWFDAFSMKANN